MNSLGVGGKGDQIWGNDVVLEKISGDNIVMPIWANENQKVILIFLLPAMPANHVSSVTEELCTKYNTCLYGGIDIWSSPSIECKKIL